MTRTAAMSWAAAVAVVACHPRAPAPPAPRYAPAYTIYLLKLAYNTPDAALAAGVFAPDEFELRAAVPPRGWPKAWRYAEEMAATRAMFAGAYNIFLDLPATDAAVGTPPPSADAFTTKPLEVILRVWRGADFCYYAQGKVTFTLKKRADAPWVITRWEDATAPAEARVRPNDETRICTWPEIKLYYYMEAEAARGAP